MTNGTQIAVIFSCRCGALYEAMQQRHSKKQYGSFKCEDCKAEVYAWSGKYDFFGWKAKKMKRALYGKPISKSEART